jgi:ABC-type multidrug transport system fused ATPase/permease subunit
MRQDPYFAISFDQQFSLPTTLSDAYPTPFSPIDRRPEARSGALQQHRHPLAVGLRGAAAVVDDRPLGTRLNAVQPSCLRPPLQAEALLYFDDLTLGYNRHPAVHHLRGEVATGSLLAIVGPNGAGKSTLLKGIAGELRPCRGGSA